LSDPFVAFWNQMAEEFEHQLAGVERWLQDTFRSECTAPADDSTGWTAVGVRDDAESALWALGRAALEAEDGGADSAERRVLVAASSVDTLAVSHYQTISAALQGVRLAGSLGDWLTRAAAAQSEGWWLDLVFEHTSAKSAAHERLRTQVSGRPLPSPVRRPLRLGRGPGLAARAREADVVGCDLSLDQLRGGRVVARMFDGAVEVTVRGIADSDPAPVGLVVRVRAGTPGRIEAVSLDPAWDPSAPPHSIEPRSIEPRSIENDWWVPWTDRAPGATMLRVRFLRPGESEGVEESLAIEGG
jgi:hypothetical protein